MAQAIIPSVSSAKTISREPEFERGMRSVPDTGTGWHLIENMQLSTGRLVKQYGVSTYATVPDATEITYLFPYRKADNTGQLLAIYPSGSTWKVRAIEPDATILTPASGGSYAGDTAFSGSSFSFVQIGLTGYLSNTDGSIYQWDGTGLTAVSNSFSSIQFAAAEGRRLVAESDGVVNFSRGDQVPITAFSGGTERDVSGAYTVSFSELPTAAIAAGGGTVIFSRQGAEMHRITEFVDGSGIAAETRTVEWESTGGGVDGPEKICRAEDKVYFVNTEGLWELNPFSGSTRNLLSEAGAIEDYWKTYDTSTLRIAACPQEQMILLLVTETGQDLPDRLLCYHLPYKAWYIKRGTTARSMATLGRTAFAGSARDGKVFQLFSSGSYTDFDGASTKVRAVSEWDHFGYPHRPKLIRGVRATVSQHPDSSSLTQVFTDGFDDAVALKSLTVSDATDTSGTAGLVGGYEYGLGKPDRITNTDAVFSLTLSSRAMKTCVEITEESVYPFAVASLEVSARLQGEVNTTKQLARQLLGQETTSTI